MTVTTSYGFPLSPGDHAGIHDIPICRDYTCPGCGTVVSISASGLVDDIREGANT